MILEVAKDYYPREYVALLRKNDEGIVIEIMLLPGTVQGYRHSSIPLHMRPIDFTVCGTIHSHPSNNYSPSEQDLHFFSRFGATHIIVRYPYGKNDWQAYNHHGEPVKLEVEE